MTVANTTIILKNSGATGNVPSSLNYGETALNYADGILYYKNSIGDISYITNSQSFSSININGTLILASSPNDILNFVPGSNISFTACTTTKTITISSDGGGIGSLSDNLVANSITSNTYISLPYTIETSGNVTANVINSNTVIDVFSHSIIRSSKYQIQISSPNGFQTTEILVIYDGLNSYMLQTSNLYTRVQLGVFSTTIYYDNVLLYFKPTATNIAEVVFNRKSLTTGSYEQIIYDLMLGNGLIDLMNATMIIDLNADNQYISG
jgi:hypothetical protein